MGTADNKPSNIVKTNHIDLNTTGDIILLVILICIIIVVTAIAFFIYYKSKSKISKLKDFNKAQISEEERNLIIEYRKLNHSDKTVINDTLKSLYNNHKDE